MDGMELTDLRSALVVAEERGLDRAARRLSIGAAVLARRIESLEREIGLVIFERRRGCCRPTHQGRVFLEEASRILRRDRSRRPGPARQ